MQRSRITRGRGGWLFLLVVLAAYAVTAAINAERVSEALLAFSRVLPSVLPVLIIVFLLLLAADLLFEAKWVKHNLGREAGMRGWFIALVGGVLATGPIYAWYALLRELRQKGMRAPLAAVFLYSRAIKLPLLPLMIHYFGLTYTLVLCAYLLTFALVNGLLMVLFEER